MTSILLAVLVGLSASTLLLLGRVVVAAIAVER
jgi:hypothetical protein